MTRKVGAFLGNKHVQFGGLQTSLVFLINETGLRILTSLTATASRACVWYIALGTTQKERILLYIVFLGGSPKTARNSRKIISN